MSVFSLSLQKSLDSVARDEWNALVSADHPFLEYDFLDVLERSGCVGEATSWRPRYQLLRDSSDRLVAACPLYEKHDSFGEYVFDHAWADAYHRAGLPYYPKGLVAAPFTPANGERLLVHPDCDRAAAMGALAETLQSYAAEAGLSSLHLLFHTEEERKILEEAGFLTRISTQFHWENRGYAGFDDFLADLRSSKRKQIRKERRQITEQNLESVVLRGAEITPEHMETMYAFYQDTGERKWGRPYLNRRWFDLIRERFADRMVLVLARERGGPEDAWIAGTLNFHKNARLYGRYWGARADYPCLHFELCYYVLIDYAIAQGVEVFEAGAQGEHKFLRGFATRPCYSSHWMLHPQGQRAIEEFLQQERGYVERSIEGYNRHSPLKELRGQESGNAPDWME